MLLIVIVVLIPVYNCSDEVMQKLSRKRRYLIFPTGSSFQLGNEFLYSNMWFWFKFILFYPNLVYDQIIPIVDNTNFLIFGVTTALAWELPDKPISKSQLMDIYENGTLPLLRRNDTVDTIDTTTTTQAANVESFKNRPLDSYYNNRNEYAGNSYYTSGGHNDISYRPTYFNKPNYKPNYKPNRYSDDNTLEQINYYSGKKYKPWKSSHWTKEQWVFVGDKKHTTITIGLCFIRQRKPYIYSNAFKRSISGSDESPEKQFFIDHHKASRHQLYDTIEKYLIA